MDSPGANTFSESTLRAEPVLHERRRLARHKAHTPAYAMLTFPADSASVEFNEILDLTEEGICVSSPDLLTSHPDVDICLELPETQSKVQGSGQVVWSANGRSGIRFSEMQPSSLHELREWLHLNGIVAAADQTTSDDPSVSESRPGTSAEETAEDFGSPETPDFSSLLLALEAVRREIAALSSNSSAALQLLAQRAQNFTRASGAAIALSGENPEEMECRASSGEAPGIGSRLNVGSGFSGQCVRTGKLLRCDDSELNLFVDRESCRSLGIRSMVALPIGPPDRVQGLLEVFSPKPRAFTECDDAVLVRLADITMTVLAGPKKSSQPSAVLPADPNIQSVTAELSSSRRRRIVLISCAAILAAALLILLLARFLSRSAPSQSPGEQSSTVHPIAAAPPVGSDLGSLRQLAEKGDAAAQFAVGAHYATGDGVTQDYTEAVAWFTRAAEQGHVVAQGTLGAYYWNSLGVHQDLNQAYFWSILAQAGGDQASKYRASILASRLTRAEVIAAQQQANDWLKQHQRKVSPPASTHAD